MGVLCVFVCQGRTALHWSCNNGYLDAVKLLLGYKAFPNHMEHTEER
jgi:inversin